MTRHLARVVVLSGLVAFVLSSCAAGDPRWTTEAPAGFWVGLWHGMIAVITFVVGLFVDGVEVYERHNSGGWYDFGFLVGVTCVWGGGSHGAGRHARRRKADREWEEIGKKVEAKVKRRIRAWAEAEPDEEWNVVEAKAEAKLKRRLREWAEEDDRPPDAPAG